MKNLLFSSIIGKYLSCLFLCLFLMILVVNGQNLKSQNMCNAVPEEIEESNFTRADKSEFVYFGSANKESLLSELIKNKCLPEKSLNKAVYIVFDGDFILDAPYVFCSGTEILARNNAQIIVKSDIQVINSYLHSCDESWKGINIYDSQIDFSLDRETKIENSDRAIGIGRKKRSKNK